MKLNISEFFGPTIQGEGICTGIPSFFLRLNGCNLNCAFRGGSICDTPYTSYNPEHTIPPMEANEVAQTIYNEFHEHPSVTHLVITGGEPMLQQNALIEMLESLYGWCYNYGEIGFPHITIETNGSIIPSSVLSKYVALWSVSPKLSTSACFEGSNLPISRQTSHDRLRINIQALTAYAAQCVSTDVQFKFVWSKNGRDIHLDSEIRDLLVRIRNMYERDYHTDNNILQEDRMHIGLMPEGTTVEQINNSIDETVDICIENNWILWDRLHIRIWGDKRGV